MGSADTFPGSSLFATPANELLLLQIKEAQTSVLAPYLAPSPFRNQGERVVTGQRIMQTASDAFLGWRHSGGTDEVDGETGNQPTGPRQFYVRRLKDQRLGAIGAEFAQIGLPDYGPAVWPHTGPCPRPLWRRCHPFRLSRRRPHICRRHRHLRHRLCRPDQSRLESVLCCD